MNPCLVLAVVTDTTFYLIFGPLAVVAVALWVRGKRLEGGIVGGFGILLLAAVVLPSFQTAKPIAFRNACVANLKQIQEAKAQWAAHHGKSSNDVPADSDLFGTDAYISTKPECPSGGSYQLGAVGQKASCNEHKLD